MSTKITDVAFIGLGNMGGGMAANLAQKGFRVRAFDLMQAHLDKAQADGCRVFTSATEAVRECDAVVSMLPNGAIVESVYIDQDALFDVMPKGTLVIDCSTVAPENSRRMAKVGTEKGMRVIDAPVSGGVAAAAAGTLAFMCGGTEADVEAARPVLAAMGANIFRAGDHGAGQVAKVCNNMLLAIHMAGTAEALQLGVNNGLDPKVLSEIMLKSSGCNWSLEKYNPYPGVQENSAASRGYTGGFMVDLMLKDLGLAMQSAQASQSSVPMGAAARNLFSLHKGGGEQNNGGLDFSSIQQLYQR
ncbi:3-hydroxyisobutyrate dehydrogenase [Simiduia sp. 21SJ11W-1]|uniref:3-hydroxyisobutyrate dehydrogenase n=1 Tax=Simiduia sp. 21SJ11W-1 TaxID=2909669 RepID=UPI00209F22B4|nr:3-hydroxyisobutyrate dehydrogenase [Simiduia sp. 21SJ11W-1]UTA47710.1 3-hydroxyisobutyrate dehydrogenase [Simiduia sp. 21SJ11W-1]